jgi:hypothetical protein
MNCSAGVAMILKSTVPAVMTVEGHLEQPILDGAHVILPKELNLRVSE